MHSFNDFTVGTAVWYKNTDDEGARWATATVTGTDAAASTLTLEPTNGPAFALAHTACHLVNPASHRGVDDLTSLAYLHEPAILDSLAHRYESDKIYTATGKILIAVNPYKAVDIYGPAAVEAYRSASGPLPPHVFGVAADAFRSMVSEGRPQCVLVSGESGAGKTETTKYMMNYFAAMSAEAVDDGSGDDVLHVERQVLESNPLLEAFGNAKTLRNDNSSRFGKFIEIAFRGAEANPRIAGAAIQTYLLEKSRLTHQAPGERTYHVFYQLLAGADEALAADLSLAPPEDFAYTADGGCTAIDGFDDAQEFRATLAAMETVGVTPDEQDQIWRVLAGILHLGNVDFSEDRRGAAQIKDHESLATACELLACDAVALHQALCTRVIITPSEWIVKPLEAFQAEAGRDALAKAIYQGLFDWLVARINTSLAAGASASPSQSSSSSFSSSISLLDIYGFESFEVNSFEQLCINYANEKLQALFNHYIFASEQAAYAEEGISWEYITFTDNSATVDLIERKPLCLISILDEECRFPKATDATFAHKVRTQFADHPRFALPKFSQTGFIVSHYAGEVTYEAEGFLAKNRDVVSPSQVAVLARSDLSLLATVFPAETHKFEPPSKGGKGGKGGKAKKAAGGAGSTGSATVTVGSKFKGSLSALMEAIGKTNPHFVRCIKPNDSRAAGAFEAPKVLHQLQCGGVLETVRVTCAGYATRRAYAEFWDRYGVIAAGAETKAAAVDGDLTAACDALLGEQNLAAPADYQLGHTMVFLRTGRIGALERLRTDVRFGAAIAVQRVWRGHVARSAFLAARRAAVRIQAVVRGSQARSRYAVLRAERAAVTIQTAYRRFAAESAFARQRWAAVMIQSAWRMFVTHRQIAALRHMAAVLTIQRLARGFLGRRTAARQARAIVTIQSLWRRRQAKDVLRALRSEARDLVAVRSEKDRLSSKVEALQWQLGEETKAKQRLAVLADTQASDLAAARQLKDTVRLLREQLKRERNARVELKAKLTEQAAELSRAKAEIAAFKRSPGPASLAPSALPTASRVYTRASPFVPTAGVTTRASAASPVKTAASASLGASVAAAMNAAASVRAGPTSPVAHAASTAASVVGGAPTSAGAAPTAAPTAAPGGADGKKKEGENGALKFTLSLIDQLKSEVARMKDSKVTISEKHREERAARRTDMVRVRQQLAALREENAVLQAVVRQAAPSLQLSPTITSRIPGLADAAASTTGADGGDAANKRRGATNSDGSGSPLAARHLNPRIKAMSSTAPNVPSPLKQMHMASPPPPAAAPLATENGENRSPVN